MNVDKNNQVVISNKTDINLIKNSIYQFIDTFILCKVCSLPELSYSIKNNNLHTDCSACGNSATILTDKYKSTVKKFINCLKPS